MKTFALIISMVMAIGFNSCKIGNLEKIIEKEKVEIYEHIKIILTELGYNDFYIHINYHKNFNNREISKSVSTVKIFGDELPINIISNTLNNNMDLEADNQVNIKNGYVETRSMVVNYDEINSGKIFYEYVSIAIFISNIEQNEINSLLKLFNNYILNNNRGDTIYIMPK
jgi:hypothetical protein